MEPGSGMAVFMELSRLVAQLINDGNVILPLLFAGYLADFYGDVASWVVSDLWKCPHFDVLCKEKSHVPKII